MQSLIDALQAELESIGQAAYQEAGPAPEAGGPQSAPQGETGKDDEDVVEGEFREA
jgi:hypothetical protein